MFGYIYITTNLINGKRYIGQKTSSKFLGNRYLGSGVALEKAISKYGKANFYVQLLEACQSCHDLNIREAYWIKLYDAVKREDFYNMREGGHGGSVRGTVHHSDSHKRYMSQRMSGANNPNYASGSNHSTPESRKARSIATSGAGNPNYGKHLSLQVREVISEKARGRVWINNGKVTKHIKPQDLSEYFNSGWVRGRKL